MTFRYPIPSIKTLLFLLCSCICWSSESNDKLPLIYAEDFFRSSIVNDAAISASGNVYAIRLNQKIYIKTKTAELQQLKFISVNYQTENLQWLSDHILVLEQRHSTIGKTKFLFLEITENQDKIVLQDESRIEHSGEILGFNKKRKEIIFAQYKQEKGRSYSDVYKIKLFSSTKLKPKNFKQLNSQSGNIKHWILDKRYRATAGISINGGTGIWVSGIKRKKLVNNWRMAEDVQLIPIKLDESKQFLTAVSNFNHDKNRIIELDIKNKRLERVIYEKANVDILSAKLDPTGSKVIAAIYLKEGLLQYDYLHTEPPPYIASLHSLLADGRIDMISSSDDETRHLLVNSAPNKAGDLYFCDITQEKCEHLSPLKSWLSALTLATTQSLSFNTDDGLTLESFLTLPWGIKDNVPLIIMPHGGPIGVQDNNYYNPHTQWLAYKGYATLRINYRGSSGYGKKILQKGFEQWGRAIEDDIEQATDNALSKFPQLNKDRMCIYGASYGGYSALMGIIRTPERYQCAVSFAGVTDLNLLFTRSRVKENKKLHKLLTRIVGDPEKNREQFNKYSPVYQFKKIKTPLMLIHGTEDTIVDIEHAWRMNLVLASADIPHKFLIFDDIGHGFDKTYQADLFYERVTRFFDQHLK